MTRINLRFLGPAAVLLAAGVVLAFGTLDNDEEPAPNATASPTQRGVDSMTPPAAGRSAGADELASTSEAADYGPVRTAATPSDSMTAPRITPEIQEDWTAAAKLIQREMLAAVIAGDENAIKVAEARAKELATATQRRMAGAATR
ncbi:MAG: hypothetical protein NXI31_19860 [bacterium]|nr:hypothetical protein [bacterium]